MPIFHLWETDFSDSDYELVGIKNSKGVTIKPSQVKNAGVYKFTIKGRGRFKGQKTFDFTIYKADHQPIKVSSTRTVIKRSKVRKRAITFRGFKLKGAKGKVRYWKSAGSKCLKINRKTGKITIAKGTKKGTYKMSVWFTASGDANHREDIGGAIIKVIVK